MQLTELPSPAPERMQGGLADSLFETADRDPTLALIARPSDASPATWSPVTAVELRDEVVDLARGFIAAGLYPGHRVAVMARTRHEWTVLCYALWAVGAEVVPLHPTSSHDQIAWILKDANCVGVVVEDEQGVMTVGSACASLPQLRHVWQLDAGALSQLVERGRSIPLASVDSLRRIVLPDSTAVIAYTSGTTGHPRGCALSHRNLASPCDALLAEWRHTAAAPGKQPAILVFLPFSHVYGLMLQGLCVRGRLLMGHEAELHEKALSSALLSFRPTFLCGIPVIFEKIYKNFLRKAQQDGYGPLFERAAHTARRFAGAVERQQLGTGPGPNLELRAQHTFYEKTVYRKLRAALGGRVCGAMSGGAPLNRQLALFYTGIGILIHDGYGLTETSGGITAQPVERQKFGTVGRPLPGTQVRVAEDGEILVRGPSVFQGYVNDVPGTRAALRGGWLATGDIGRLDTEGYLTVTGRKKDVIITSGGRSVAPAALEERLRVHPLIHQAVVVGDNRPCVGALITLDPEFLAHWRRSLPGPGEASSRDVREENALREEVMRAIAAANTPMSRSESIRVFRILPEPLDPANGMLTPSMKLRRDAISRHFAAEIDAMYATSSRGARRSVPVDPFSWADSDNVFQ
ncbi:AMP-dependent synthetase/ligase [Streptomyces sporangiiformans]|nr:AMP-dependent synthetase/ligase [Streptomyces sporangiiformans]